MASVDGFFGNVVKGNAVVADPVIGALAEQVECYSRLAKLAELQHEHVQQSQTEALLEVLARRQEVLDQIGRLERVIVPAKGSWAAYLGGLTAERRALAEKLLAQTRQLLEQITAADRNDCLVLQRQKIDLGRQIGQAAVAKTVNRKVAVASYGVQVSRVDVKQ